MCVTSPWSKNCLIPRGYAATTTCLHPSPPMRPLHKVFGEHVSFPQLWLLLPISVGIFVGRTWFDLFQAASVWLTVVTLVAACATVGFHFWRGAVWRLLSLFSFVTLVMCCGMWLSISAIHRTQAEWLDAPQTYAVRLTSLPRHRGHTLQADAQILRGTYTDKHIRLYLPDTLHVEAGQTLWIYGTVSAPVYSGNPYAFDWADYLLTQGISGTIYTSHVAAMPQTASGFNPRLWALHLQAQAVNQLETYFDDSDLAILAAMTLGDKRQLNATIREPFAQTGTSHLLALSGLHIGILFALYHFLVLRRLRQRRWLFVGVGLGLLLIWLYAMVAGMPLSLQRAATMLSLMQLLQLARRESLGLDRLFASAILLLLFSPLALFDLGFQLSFLSVAAIMWLKPLFPKLPYRFSSLVRHTYEALLVSFTAFIGTLPLIAYTFHTIGTYTLFANLIAVVLATPLLVLSLFFFLFPFAVSLLVPCLKCLLSILTGTLQFFASLPGATLDLYPTGLGTVVGMMLILLLSAYLYTRRKPVGLSALALLFFLVGEEVWAHRLAPPEPQIVFYNLWRGSAVQAISRDGHSYVWMQGDDIRASLESQTREFWHREHIDTPYVLTASYRDRELAFVPPLLSFGDQRIAVLASKQPYHYNAPSDVAPTEVDTLAPHIDVDYLYVCKGYSGQPAHTLQTYRSGTVVLDHSLGPIYRRMWHNAADSLHRPVHDMDCDGALVVRCVPS